MSQADPDRGPGDAPRIAELDGLRGLAVLMVLAWHYVGATIDPSIALWAKGIARTLILGRTGVDLFFVLSGFLITGIVLDRRSKALAFLGSFYIRRALRILPPYLCLVLVFWLMVAAIGPNSAFNADTPLWRHLTFTQNQWMAQANRWGPDAISVTWSVAIEEQFYLAFPLVMLALPRRAVPASLLAIAAASICWRAWIYFGPGSAFAPYVSTLARLDGLAFGGTLAWVWRHPHHLARLQSRRRLLLVGSGVCLGLTPLLAAVIARDPPWHMSHWAHTYLALFYTAILASVLLAADLRLTRPLRGRLLRSIGSVSYAVYLFHPFMLSCAFLVAGRTEHIRDLQDVLTVAAALAATFAFCAFSARVAERPLVRFGHRFAY